MAAAGVIGHGLSLTLGGTPITDILSVQFSGKATDSIEITSNASAINAKEFIPGMIDHGTCVFTCNYKDSVFKTLADAQDARTSGAWVYTSPQADTYTFTGFIMSGEVTYNVQAKTEMTWTVKITGLPVLAAV